MDQFTDEWGSLFFLSPSTIFHADLGPLSSCVKSEGQHPQRLSRNCVLDSRVISISLFDPVCDSGCWSSVCDVSHVDRVSPSRDLSAFRFSFHNLRFRSRGVQSSSSKCGGYAPRTSLFPAVHLLIGSRHPCGFVCLSSVVADSSCLRIPLFPIQHRRHDTRAVH